MTAFNVTEEQAKKMYREQLDNEVKTALDNKIAEDKGLQSAAQFKSVSGA